jgi:RND superfamily putative drug exporter
MRVPTGLIARMGRWCFRHWAWVLLAWVAAVAAGVFATGPVFDRLAADNIPQDVESIRAYDTRPRATRPSAP